MSIKLTAYLTPARPQWMLNKFVTELADVLSGAGVVQDYIPMSDGNRFAAVSLVIEPTGYLVPFDEFARPALVQHVKDMGLASGLDFSEVLYED